MCGIILCSTKKETKLIIVLCWSTVYFTWYLYSPIYAGLPTIIKSSERPIMENGIVRNWGDTVTCTPKIYHAKEESDIYEALDNQHLRVLGSTHSWSGLVCSDHAVLTLEYCTMSLNDTILEASAGCKISDIQIFLGKRQRMLYGFGSIMGQTLAGASLTSLHGVQFDMFTTHVVKIHAILANKSKVEVEGDQLRYWVSSMGMLGIVTDIHLQTYEHSSIIREAKHYDFDKAIEFIHNDSIQGLAITGVLENDIFYVETFSNIQPSNFTGLKEHSIWTAFLFDNIAQPLFMLFGQTLKIFNFIKIMHREHTERIDMNHAWSHMVGFTSGSGSEYSVPIEKCKETLQKIRDLDMFSHVYIRKVHASHDVLPFAAVDSCCIEPYLFYTYNYKQDYEKFTQSVEQFIIEAGGRTHWGKQFNSKYEGLVPDSFKQYRKETDPNNLFMNNFTRTLLEGRQFTYKPIVAGYRSIVWISTFWVAVGVTCTLQCIHIARSKALRVFSAYLTVIFAWIAYVQHENNFVHGHRHGHNHAGMNWAIIWLIVSIALMCLTIIDIHVQRLRIVIFITAFIDSLIKIFACDHCTHGLSSLIMAISILGNITVKYKHKYTRLN